MSLKDNIFKNNLINLILDFTILWIQCRILKIDYSIFEIIKYKIWKINILYAFYFIIEY